MDIQEQRYRKIINTFRPLLNNVISQYPIPSELQVPVTRNLKYIVQKQKFSNNIPFSQYTAIPEEIKQLLNDSSIEARMLAIRLIRCLPFHYRVKVIEETENELSMLITRQAQGHSPDKKTIGYNAVASPQFHYETTADMVDLLLSVYELTGLSEEIYFDVNQKITALLTHILQKCSSTDRNVSRNSYEALRSIFLVFSQCKGRADHLKKLKVQQQIIEQPVSMGKIAQFELSKTVKNNKLINKIISNLSKDQSYQIPLQSNNSNVMGMNTQSSSNPRLRQLIMKTREYQIRVRCRMLTGICYLLTYIPQYFPQLYQLLTQQIFIIIENANEFDINLQCFLCIKAILALPLSHHLRSSLIKKWIEVLSELCNSYKKQYFPFYIQILKEVCEYQYCPLKVKYFASTSFLQITKSIQQQLSRFIVYKFSCRNIMMITNYSICNPPNPLNTSMSKIMNKGASKKQSTIKSNNIIINIFHYDWFVNRVKEENDLFKSQFLICLLHAYFTYPNRLSLNNKSQIRDLLDLCHYMLVWSSNCKEETHIPTVKFVFDMYLEFLKEAAERLEQQIQKYVVELIQKCNSPTMSLLFKFKLISTLIRLSCYSASILPYSETKLKLDFLEGQIQLFMMPKNSKPIFDYQYSLTVDGEIQSRKEIQTIKVIMDLLAAIEKVYQNDQKTVDIVSNMIIRYHQYLSNLQMVRTSNKELINCLQSLQADNYFSVCQRNFLLSLIDEQDSKGNNIEYTLNDKIVFSPFETFDSDEEYNIFGGMSPVHLKIRLLGGRGYTSVYIQAKKSQWVGLPEMKLIVSSAIEVKQVPFQSCIIEIKIDRSGLINFEAWSIEDIPRLLGSGSHRINRKFLWLEVNHLRIIDGIRCRGQLMKLYSSINVSPKQMQNMKDKTYLTYCFGQPVLVQLINSKNQIVVTVNNKQVWNQVQEVIWKMVEQLINGTAQVNIHQ